jgi:hypothetical protein
MAKVLIVLIALILVSSHSFASVRCEANAKAYALAVRSAETDSKLRARVIDYNELDDNQVLIIVEVSDAIGRKFAFNLVMLSPPCILLSLSR